MKKILNKNRIIFGSIILIVLLVSSITFFFTYGKIESPIINYSSTKDSGVIENVVYINSVEDDYYYYKGLNYTYSSNQQLPTGTNQNLYTDNNLVQVNLTYHGEDVNGYKGYISTTERQDTFIYYKVYPVNNNGTSSLTDDYIMIDTIENPFLDRPKNRAFYGWISKNNNVDYSFDNSYKTRHVKVPVTYENGYPKEMDVDLYAAWGFADIGYVNKNSSWSNAFSSLKTFGMHEKTFFEYIYGDVDMTGYYHQESVGWFGSCTGLYNSSGQLQNNCTCNSFRGCTYYSRIENENFDENDTYYYLQGNNMRQLDNSTIEKPLLGIEPIEGFKSTDSLAGYFKKVTISRNGSIAGLYSEAGVYQSSGTCTSSNCTYYELIKYGNNDNYVEGTSYYYLTTRDTNIVVMSSGMTSSWSSSENKPFTLTQVYNGNDYRTNYMWNVSNVTVNLYADTTIENMRISAGTNNLTSSGTYPSNSNTATKTLYGNWYNLRIGRGITRNDTYVTFTAVEGGNNPNQNNTTVKKYRTIIEQGFYNNLSLSAGANNGTQRTLYIENKSIYGNDYDRALNNNNSLNVVFCASAAWSGNIYTSNAAIPMFDLVVKSGSFGTGKFDLTTGIYVGGRYGGTHNASRKITIQGGYIYNLNGGPLTSSSRTNVNDTYIYMTGGNVDVIIGGAGTTATYGNRIIQVTGGKVNYSVFGGSNGSDGSEGDGTLNGSSFIYVGGNSVIGDDTLITASSKMWGAESGSIFGIGNGKTGSSTIGSAANSNIFIRDEANIKGNVYGGGNYGAVGVSTSAATAKTTIDIDGAIIDGSIYGGGNNNGSGSGQTVSTINITMNSGKVLGSVYGGSNEQGTIYGNSNVTINGGTISGSVYGGGRGGYRSNNNTGTFVQRDVNVVIGNNNGGPTITNNVYGGSAFGTVNGTSSNPPVSTYTTKVTINNGTVSGAVFGGGEGDDNYTPYVGGNITVTINNGNINEVFGGNNISGTPKGSDYVYLKGGTIKNVYGGGNQTSLTTTNVYLQGSTVTNIFGGSNEKGDVTTSNITLTSGSSTGAVYGGNNVAGKTSTSNVTLNGATTNFIYGGGKLATTGKTKVTLNSGTSIMVFGGGEEADVDDDTTISLAGGTHGSIYGGSNTDGNIKKSTISTTGGTVSTIYGGNNEGGKTNVTNINVDGAKITTIYGGGNKADSNETNIDILKTDNQVLNVYGGGNEASVTTTNINLYGGRISNVFGGSNKSNIVNESNINVTNNTAPSTANPVTITTSKSSRDNYTGNGYKYLMTVDVEVSNTTNEDIELWDGIIDIANSLLANNYSSTEVIQSGSIYSFNQDNVYWETNIIPAHDSYFFSFEVYTNDEISGIRIDSNLFAISESGKKYNYASSPGSAVTNIFGGNNAGGKTEDTHINVTGGTVRNIYGGGNEAITDTTEIIIDDATISGNIFGGGNQAAVSNDTSITITDATIKGNLFGGGNNGSVVLDTSIDISKSNLNYIYAGGNGAEATVSGNTYLKIYNNSNVINDIYGGGNAGKVNTNANVDITDLTINGSIYGAGNGETATLNGNAILKIDGDTTAKENIFGGGNAANILGNTEVYITDAKVTESIYAGGNGQTAIVSGNTTLFVDGKTIVGESIFGGGNAAATGTESVNNSKSLVNIAGATVGKNIYGGANTSVLYGITKVNIGSATIDEELKSDDIVVNGTIFGGGEANASGSENYDYTFISVTTGIIINIDGSENEILDIKGSIFGSGNASSSGGYSYIDISNYGTEDAVKLNVSIQRADVVTMTNSFIELKGTTDRTNEYSTTLFTLSRIDELKLANNSRLYLQTGANLLKKFNSLLIEDDSETKSTVSINDGKVTKNVDNRLFIYDGKVLNVATNQSVTTYGEVYGMTFFGRYTHDRSGNIYTALYDEDYNDGDIASSSDIYAFANSSYVLGQHYTNHDIKVDGFYTNDIDKETNKIKVDYITPTPDAAAFYMWVVGEPVSTYEVDLVASKYSTLGAYELPLINDATANTTFSIVDFNYNDISSDFEFVSESNIPRVAQDGKADTRMGLSLKSSNTGWITIGSTEFLTNDNNKVSGTTDYQSENSSIVPTFLLYLYHSKNLQTAGNIGTVTISMLAITPINDLENDVSRINININLSRALYATNEYEGAMTEGEQFGMFASTAVDITNKSKLSAYYSLFIESDNSIYKTGYYRTLVSSFVLPENTKITMVDLNSIVPEYYYYVVSSDDVRKAELEFAREGEASYNLSNFIRMGSNSTNNNYDDEYGNINYYNKTAKVAQEEFTFIVDFADTNITSNHLDNTLLIELRNKDDQTLISVLGIQVLNMTYNIYANKDAVIDLKGSIDSSNIYLGETSTISLETSFNQQTYNSKTIYDTSYFNKKLGVKITILDKDKKQINGMSMLGLYYEYNDEVYYPRVDGSVRFNIAERIANISSKIKLNTSYANMVSGNYILKIESFGSGDGIYYGLESSDTLEIPITIVNSSYGLSVTTQDSATIIDKKTGLLDNGNNAMVFTIGYQSQLSNPNIRIVLQRRKYTEIYSTEYYDVDLQDYVTNTLNKARAKQIRELEYLISNNPSNTSTEFMYMKKNLMSGTYRFVFELYDNNTFIGEVYKYVIIK